METGRPRSAALAGLLSAILPGLGQFYNRQWGKGLGFLIGVILGFLVFLSRTTAILGSTDLAEIQQSAASPTPPEGLGLLSLLGLLVVGVAIWSIVDAARSAKRPTSSG
jgi:Na+-transporting NADH:ubiquinone oxidoreductase subunit NqrD